MLVSQYYEGTRSPSLASDVYGARFPFKRNRLRCVRCINKNRKKRKRLRLNENRASVGTEVDLRCRLQTGHYRQGSFTPPLESKGRS